MIRHTWLCWLGALLVALLALVGRPASALNPVSWKVSLSTTGQDVFWTSPTALTPGFPEYDWSYVITEATANVLLLGNQNLLPQLGDAASGADTFTGLPIEAADEPFTDSFTGSTAHIKIGIDENGFGHASGTDIDLGTVLGLPIRRVDLKATITALGIPEGDYDRNGTVNAQDYQLWRANFGSVVNLQADGNHNLVVDASDFTIWRDALSGAGAAASAISIPEPTSTTMLIGCFLFTAYARRNRVR